MNTMRPSRKLHCRSRAGERDALEGLFEQVLRMALELGAMKLGRVAIDGTKIKANASKHKAMSYKRIQEEEQRLPEEARRLLAGAEQVAFCRAGNLELEQIQFLLGHASVQTTERYLGCEQKLSQAVNDNLGLQET
jgi:hypothetical protein